MAHERSEQPDSPETRYPMGWAILRRLQQYVNTECDVFRGEQGEDVFKALYLTEKDGCIPEHLLGEDLLDDIINIYSILFDAVAHELHGRLQLAEDISVYVHPDWRDRSHVLLVTSTRVLLIESRKPWNLWWRTEEGMAKQLEGWYRTAETALLNQPGPRLEPSTAEAIVSLVTAVEKQLTHLRPRDETSGRPLRASVATVREWMRQHGIAP